MLNFYRECSGAIYRTHFPLDEVPHSGDLKRGLRGIDKRINLKHPPYPPSEEGGELECRINAIATRYPNDNAF